MDRGSYLNYFILCYFIDNAQRNLYERACEALLKKGLVDINMILKEAKENKLSYQLSKKLYENKFVNSKELIEKMLREDEKSIFRLKKTLNFLNFIFKKANLEFLVIKTYKKELFVTADIDIIVKLKNYEQVIEILEENGFVKGGGTFYWLINKLKLGTPDFIAKDMLTVDLYGGIPWKGFTLMDEEFLWQNPKLMYLDELKYFIPNAEADFLSIVLSTIFTDIKLTFLDFSYLDSLIKNGLNYELLFWQAKKFKWANTLAKYISILQGIKNNLYGDENIMSKIKFPISIPLSFMMKALFYPVLFSVKSKPQDAHFTLTNVAYRCFFGRFYAKAAKILNTI